MLGETKKQFSLTRAALNAGGLQKSNLLSVTLVRSSCVIGCILCLLAPPRAVSAAGENGVSWLDKLLLDPQIRRVGESPDSASAKTAKALGKDWLNPYATPEELEKDINAIKLAIGTDNESLRQVAEDSKLSAREKREQLLRYVGDIRTCSTCQLTFPLNYAFCPYDGTRLFVLSTPQPQAKPILVLEQSDEARSLSLKILAQDLGIATEHIGAVRNMQKLEKSGFCSTFDASRYSGVIWMFYPDWNIDYTEEIKLLKRAITVSGLRVAIFVESGRFQNIDTSTAFVEAFQVSIGEFASTVMTCHALKSTDIHPMLKADYVNGYLRAIITSASEQYTIGTVEKNVLGGERPQFYKVSALREFQNGAVWIFSDIWVGERLDSHLAQGKKEGLQAVIKWISKTGEL